MTIRKIGVCVVVSSQVVIVSTAMESIRDVELELDNAYTATHVNG